MLQTMKIWTLFLFLCLFTTSQAQVSDAYKETLKKMFDAMGTEETFENTIVFMIDNFKTRYPDVKSEFWDELEEQFLDTSMKQLVDMYAVVYVKYMTIEDLDEIILFYKSPVGKKLAKNTPLITEEAMLVGQEWGRKIGENIVLKLKEKGYSF